MLLEEGRLTPRGAGPAAAGARSGGSGAGGPAEEGFCPSYRGLAAATK